MKITYITNAIIPSVETHSYQITKMCEAFVKNKVKIDLILPAKTQGIKKLNEFKNIWDYYGIQNTFNIQKMPYLIWINPYYTSKGGFLRSLLQTILFTIFFIFYSLIKKPEIYFVRDLFWATYISSLKFLHRRKVYYEGHKPEHGIIKIARNSAIDGLIVNTNQLKNYYLERGIPKEMLFVAPNGVDLKMFKNLPSKITCRKELKIPLDKKIICYTGHLYNWKGTKILAKASKNLKKDTLCYIVGGLEKDIKSFKNFIKKNKIQNVIIVGHVPPILVPKYLKASDVLVLPNLKGGESRFSSPIKMFEYMASKRPIVASDIPSLREVLNEKNSILVEPNKPKTLSIGIKKAIMDKELAEKMSKNTYRTAKRYDWSKRAKNIIKFMENK